jgi:hydrogenase maturation protein HypF
MASVTRAIRVARRIHVRGVVQGVGFRPYIFRLARTHALHGWVINGDDGVRMHIEGSEEYVEAFVKTLEPDAPAAARIAFLDVEPVAVAECADFEIRHSESGHRPTTRIAPDLPICHYCLHEMFQAADSRFRYPYINCTNCGPRFSIVRALPYDRANTTMAA